MPRGAKPGERRGGRAKGTPNKVTAEIRERAREFLEDPMGQARLLEQWREGTLNPAVLQMLHHYAYGKPKETLMVEGELPPFRLVIDGSDSDDPPSD